MSFLAASVNEHVDARRVSAARVWSDTAMALSIASGGVAIYTARTTDGPEAMAASAELFRAIEAAAREIAEWCEREAAARAAVARDWGDVL